MKAPYDDARCWQEYDCPVCGIDIDVRPIPRPGDVVACYCGHKWQAGEHSPNTYAPDCTCVAYPLEEEA